MDNVSHCGREKVQSAPIEALFDAIREHPSESFLADVEQALDELRKCTERSPEVPDVLDQAA